MKAFQVSEHNSPRRPTFKPLLEDALQVLKGPLHNPEAKDFKKITSVMKNCSFFRESFSSQVALNEFVELAKFYVGYEAHKYGTVLLPDTEYVEKLFIILDGTVEKIFQKPFEEQIHNRKRFLSFPGFETSPLQTKTQLPSLKSPRTIDNGEVLLTSSRRVSTPKGNSGSSQFDKISRPPSQQRKIQIPTLEDEIDAKPYRAFEELMGFIADKKPELKRKYYFKEVFLRAERIKSLTTGDYFGEGFCLPSHPRSNHLYAVSSPEAHLLTLNREEYNEIMKELKMRHSKKLEAFLVLFSSFEKDIVQRFSEYFSQKSFQADEVIYFQGFPVQDLYIVQSGEVQFSRKLSGGSSGIAIASVVKNHVFGEESLLSMDYRQESAIAKASNTSVFVLKASLISELREEFDDLFVELRKQAEEKFQWRQKKAMELLQRERSPSDSPNSPLNDMKGLFSPRHSIQISHRRSFVSEKSPTQSTIVKPRKLSDGEVHEQNKRNEKYKTQFGRAVVVSEINRTTQAGKNGKYFQVGDISPGADLKTMNFRKELYGGGRNLSVKSPRYFEKVTSSQSSQDVQQKLLKTICNNHAEIEKYFSDKLIKIKSDK